MAQVYQPTARTSCPYLVLGVKPGCDLKEVDLAYRALVEAFREERLSVTPQGWVQAQQALIEIENAYQRIKEGDLDEILPECQKMLTDPVPPKLGQLLVAAGKITLEELEEAIKQQETVDLPLGEILKGSSLITQMELDQFLLNQRSIRLPIDSPYQFGQRLVGMGLITEDMALIALIEDRSSDRSFGEILVNRGWLAKEIYEVLA